MIGRPIVPDAAVHAVVEEHVSVPTFLYLIPHVWVWVGTYCAFSAKPKWIRKAKTKFQNDEEGSVANFREEYLVTFFFFV